MTTGQEPPDQLCPWGSNTLDFMVAMWENEPLINGPGVPIASDALDLSQIKDPDEHWYEARRLLHPHAGQPVVEPGLRQWNKPLRTESIPALVPRGSTWASADHGGGRRRSSGMAAATQTSYTSRLLRPRWLASAQTSPGTTLGMERHGTLAADGGGL